MRCGKGWASSKRQRIKAELRDASPPQAETPASTSAATNQAPGAPALSTSTRGVVINEWTWLLHKSGLDCGTAEGDVSPPQRQPSIPSAPAAVPSPADAPISKDEDEYSNCSADDCEDDSDCDEPTTINTCGKLWTENEDIALVAALRAGQKVSTIEIGGRSGRAARKRLSRARENGSGSPVLREYLEETCPEYVYKPSHRQRTDGWSAEEDQTFIRAHKEGKTHKEIAAMLPGRTHDAVGGRWYEARIGNAGTAALREYAAEFPLPQQKPSPWSAEEDQTFIRAHKEGKTQKEIVAMLPGRTKGAVCRRWGEAKKRKAGTAALIAYAAEYIPSGRYSSGRYSPWSVDEDHTMIRAHKEGKTFEETQQC